MYCTVTYFIKYKTFHMYVKCYYQSMEKDIQGYIQDSYMMRV